MLLGLINYQLFFYSGQGTSVMYL